MTKNINLRFSDEEFKILVDAVEKSGIRGKSNFIRFHIIPLCLKYAQYKNETLEILA